MNYVLFRSVGTKETLAEQENLICDYVSSAKIKIDSIFTEFSSLTKELDLRDEIKAFMDNLKDYDKLIFYDLWSLSSNADELVKMFTCLFKKNIDVYIVKKRVVVNKNSSSYLVVGMINEIREMNIAEKNDRTNGRPKGSISKSKFDDLKNEIMVMLQNGDNVSEISRKLDVNRSSLKDFINSRGLKELASRAKNVAKLKYDKISGTIKILESIECPFQKEKEQKKLNSRSST